MRDAPEMWPWIFSGVTAIGGFLVGRFLNVKAKPTVLDGNNAQQQNFVSEREKDVRQVLPSVASSAGIPDYASTILGVTTAGTDLSTKYFVAAGSRRGTSHVESGLARQDNFAVISKEERTYLVVSDGVSSAEEAQIGSTFLVQNFERILDEVFPGGFSEDSVLWQELNKKLSQNLVAMHVSRLKRQGQPVAESVDSLRRDAANLFAATLEILVSWPQNGSDSIEYFAVRLAGDGKLFKISDKVEDLNLGGAAQDNIKVQTVRALPIYDGSPAFSRGVIGPGESLALATDGIGDFLEANSDWSEKLRMFCSSKSPSEQSLLDLVSQPDSNSRDDRTIGIVINAR